MKVCAWFLLACGLFPTLALAQTYRPEVPIVKVLHEGEAVPGLPGVTFTGFSPPQIDAEGNVLVRACMTGPGIDDSNNCAIWFGQPGAMEMVARDGEIAPDIGHGVVYASVNVWATVSETGWIAFSAYLSGPGVVEGENDAIIYCGPPGDFRKVIRAGDPAPGFWAGVEVFDSSSQPLGAALTDNGTLSIGGGVRGPDLPEEGTRAYWLGSRDNQELMVWWGMPVIGCPECDPEVTLDSEDYISLNDAGQMAFRGEMSGPGISHINDRGRWIGSAAGWEMIHRDGQAMPELGEYVIIESSAGVYYTLNRHGDKVNRIRLLGLGITEENDWLLLAGESEPLNVIVREGDPVPEAGEDVHVASIGGVYINDLHHIIYRLRYDGPSIDDTNLYGIHYGPYTASRLILRDGEPAPFFPSGTVLRGVGGVTSRAAMNDVGDFASMTAIDVPPLGDESVLGLWIWHGLAEQYIPLLEPGAALYGRTATTDAYGYFGDYWTLTGGSDGRPQSFNDRRQLAVQFDFTDGTRGVYRVGPPILGDTNGDGEVTFTDLSTFIDCMTGPGGEYQPGCEPLDFDLDSDIDLADFRVLQAILVVPEEVGLRDGDKLGVEGLGQIGTVEEPFEQRAAKPPEQLAEVGGRRCQDDVDRVSFQPRQEAPPHAMITLQMPDLRLNRTASPSAFTLTAGKML